MKAKCENTVYLGDMYVDYLTARNSKVSFIFANYGYRKRKLAYKATIKRITDLRKFV